jgi:hypothetical protein
MYVRSASRGHAKRTPTDQCRFRPELVRPVAHIHTQVMWAYRKDGRSIEHLSDDTADGPHVDGVRVVTSTIQQLGCAVPTRCHLHGLYHVSMYDAPLT